MNLLHNLDPHKAPGSDGIPARFLKETCNSIAPALVLMYKASLKQGKLPRDWKRAYVVPIFKKGSRNDPSNYQPISLTCICCKLLEHIASFLLPFLLMQTITTLYALSNMDSEKIDHVRPNCLKQLMILPYP